jgi:pimeloyl-ACP methyl ester carboxylesterase
MEIEHHTIIRGDHHWHVVTSGSPAAPALLLLHCWTGNWKLWENLIPLLGTKFYVIAPDHLGFGQSDKPKGDHYAIDQQAERARFILRQFGVERASVMGHSMGGQIALTFAGMYPETVERLIVVDPAVTGKMHLIARLGSQWLNLVRWGIPFPVDVAVRLAVRFPRLGLPFATMYFPRPNQQREAALYWMNQLIADDQLSSAAFAEHSISTWDVTPRLAKITAPTLAIWGTADYCIPMSECLVLETHIQNFRTTKIPEIGHFPMIEAWPTFKDEVVNFLGAS